MHKAVSTVSVYHVPERRTGEEADDKQTI